MRQNLSKLETAILSTIDTGNNRRSVKEDMIKETGCSVIEADKAIKRLKVLGLLRYEDHGTFLIASFAQHHGKDIKYDQSLEIYSYEDGQRPGGH